MKLTFKGRKVDVDVCIEYHHCDSYFSSGYYLDTLEELTEDELISLQNLAEQELAEYCMERCGGWRD